MKTNIVIIGSGIAGLYSAYTIKKKYPLVSFIILEKYPKKYVGGRIGNDTFYGTEIVRGAGIGRAQKDILLQQLLIELNIPIHTFTLSCNYAPTVDSVVNIDKTIKLLKTEFVKNRSLYIHLTFSQFAKKILGYQSYSQFVETTGYSDYEKSDIWQTLTDYGMDDNKFQSIGFKFNWNELTKRLIDEIGPEHFIFSQNVERIAIDITNNQYIVETCPKTSKNYNCHTVIVATTIDTLRTLFPQHSIYSQIEGQPFVRIYGKFTKRSAMIMQQHVSKMTIVRGILQKIIPIDTMKGVYMIAYSDNQNAKELFQLYDNTDDNRQELCRLLEKSLDIPTNELDLIAIKSYYWHIGTHYYKPFVHTARKEFIKKAQHPANNILVVGEVVSRNQGWVEGALQSVNDVLLPK